MLILTRKTYESVFLKLPNGGGTVRVVVTEIDRGRCRLGFDAPPGVQIVRDELYADWRGREGGGHAPPAAPTREDEGPDDPTPDEYGGES